MDVVVVVKLHVKYFESGDTYDDGVNGSQIGNHPWAIDSQCKLQKHWADTRFIEHISCISEKF